MKPLLPTLKERKRYVLFDIISTKKVSENVQQTISKALSQYLGTRGIAQAGARLIHNTWDVKKQQGIIRTNHTHVDAVKTAITLIKQIDNQDVVVRNLKVSGILNKARGE